MTKLALLVGANPRVSENGPKVRLGVGKWSIITEGVVDSDLCVNHTFSSGSSIEVDIPSSCFVGPCDVEVRFNKRGKESHISVYAEQHGT